MPEEHQASMALVLLEDVLGSNYGRWLLDALQIHATATFGQLPETEKFLKLDKRLVARARGLELVDEELRSRLPQIDFERSLQTPSTALAKFYLPGSYFTWYASEFDGEDLFFGLVATEEIEQDYFSLSDLMTWRSRSGQPVARDPDFEPASLDELHELHEKRRLQW